MSGVREWKLGPHTIRFEPPRLLWFLYQGRLTLEQAAALTEILRELTRTHPVDVIGDMSAADPLTPEVQSYFGDHARPDLFRISIYFGARLVHKALIKGMLLANQMTASDSPPAEVLLERVHYVATREDAERLLHELRARLPSPED